MGHRWQDVLGNLAIAMLVAVLAIGCTKTASGEQQPIASPTTSAAAPSTTIDPQADAKAAIEEAYKRWSADVSAANRNPAGAYNRLDDHMMGDALKTMQVFIIDRRHRGLVARGTVRFGPPRILSVSGSEAVAQSCVDSSKFVDYRAGKLVKDSEGTIRSYRITFTFADGWKVSGFTSREARCAA
jgi:hypothetical protein